jgi:hypothetical protein
MDSVTSNTWTRCNPMGFGRSGARGGQDPFQRITRIVARVNLQDVAAALVEPRQQDDLLPRGDAIKRPGERRIDLDPRLRRTFRALLRGLFSGGEAGMDDSDRA